MNNTTPSDRTARRRCSSSSRATPPATRRRLSVTCARPVHQIISMIKWIRTSRLSIKNSLALQGCTSGLAATLLSSSRHIALCASREVVAARRAPT